MTERKPARRSRLTCKITPPCDPTYTLIYSFLKKQSHSKAAEAVKNAAKDVVVLKDSIELDGPSLDEVVKTWKTITVASSYVDPIVWPVTYTDVLI